MTPHIRTPEGGGVMRGQSMVEYLVLLALAVSLVAVPVDGQPSAIALMLDAVRTAYQKFLAALSLPY